MPLFEGHKDSGIERLFIELPDDHKNQVLWKYPDSQIMQHSVVNVDIDYLAVFTNLGKVIGTLPPGRHVLDEGASLALGWLIDRLTGNAYYDAELYYVSTRDFTDNKFGGPVDNITDKNTSLIVAIRAFGELAFKVIDPVALISKLVGSSGDFNPDTEISTWIKEQTMASLRSILPDIVADHGVLFMGQIQDQIMQATLNKANQILAPYGLKITTFAELNVSASDEDLANLKKLAQAKAYTEITGSYSEYAKGQALLNISEGIEEGKVTGNSGVMMGMMMSQNAGLGAAMQSAPQVVQPTPQPSPTLQAVPGAEPKFCINCGNPLVPGAKFCAQCGTQVPAISVPQIGDQPPTNS
jgi:membrane protease subunit (stomatin/prohibitin family)